MAATYTEAQIGQTLNSAADDVLEAIDAPDEGVRDAINLVVNVAMHYLEHPEPSDAHSVQSAIDASYELDNSGDGPIEWAQR
jgi:hypothetical protein